MRAASDTAIIAPIRGLAFTYRELQSTVSAKAFLLPLIETMAASDIRLVLMFTVRTIESYCSYTQRFDAILG